MGNRTHRGQRSKESLELRKARQYCFLNSKYDPKLQERIFVKLPEDTERFVRVAVEGAVESEILETPQGLVLADNRCGGFFQRIEPPENQGLGAF